MSVRRLFLFSLTLLITALSGCATIPPSNPDNICSIFKENRDWYHAAIDAKNKWGAPVQVPMAIMYQESSFQYDAEPPMRYFLWIIPIGRASDAYGYSQAKTVAWREYKRETGNRSADRDNLEDAMDFMGWYINKTQRINKVSKWNAYGQYLNYHEGRGGYRKKSYLKKTWLMKVARKVERRAKRYGRQYWGCKKSLAHSWFWRMFD